MRLQYNWNMYPEVINTFLKIYTNTRTIMELEDTDIKYAFEFCYALEDYLYYFRSYGYDVNKINKKLKDIQYFNIFQNNQKGDNNIIYMTQEPVINTKDAIYINSRIQGDERLNDRERRALYLYKGLNKHLFKFLNDRTDEFSNEYSVLFDDIENNEANKILINGGWLLLEETLSQELAERITYETLGKTRPSLRPGLEHMDNYPIAGSKVSSRLEEYRPFEELTIRFGGTISGVGSLIDYSENRMMDDLINKAITTNFSDSVISEYIFNQNEIELCVALYNMGLLLNEKYATYGNRMVKEKVMDEKEVNKTYDRLIYILNGLFTLDQDEYSDIPLRKVNNNIFVKKRIKDEMK